jgi:TRAP-type mannitol/chloroaromatic compound transport system permease small subunit
MSGLKGASDGLARTLRWFGRFGSYLCFAMIAVIVVDVIGRQIPGAQTATPWPEVNAYLASTRLQELEWHLHTAIFALALGYAYVTNAHVRVDLLRERWSCRRKLVVEMMGIAIFVIPYIGVLLLYAVEFSAEAFVLGEASMNPGGMAHRWFIKGVLALGLLLVLLSAVAVFLRHWSALRDLKRGTYEQNAEWPALR